MTVEQQPETLSQLDPPKKVTEEMSLGAGLYRLVDDLFTHQAIAEKLQGLGKDEAVAALVESWKYGLTRQLEATAQHSVQHAVGMLEMLQANGAEVSITKAERQEWERIETWHRPFEVATICREDLRGILSDEEIVNLTDGEMQQLATKMSDTYQESGDYWETLKTSAQLIVTQKQDNDETNPPQPSTKAQPTTSGQANSTPS